MAKIISVRFRDAGKVYYFSPGDRVVHKGSHVIVETSRGVEYGVVASEPMELPQEKLTKPVKEILRIANERDEEQEASNREKEKEAFRVCQEKIREHNLDMKLINAEYTFDNNKVLFYFTADGRIDFRLLVKDLASVFKTRIELRQIGVRDETRLLGGMGICGRPLCCHSYLTDFVPVSIKMAKEQGLSLNPTKISGVCGRLMCCLKNEEDAYEEINKKLPHIGDIVTTDDGLEGEVTDTNAIKETVRIIVEDGDTKEVHDVPAETVHFLRKKPKHNPQQPKNGGEEEKIDRNNSQENGGKGNNQNRGRRGTDNGQNENRSGKEGGNKNQRRDRDNRGRTGQDNGENRNRGNQENGENKGRENQDNKGNRPDQNGNGGKNNQSGHGNRRRRHGRGGKNGQGEQTTAPTGDPS